MDDLLRIDTISTLHAMLNEPPPKHPLISVMDLSKLGDTLGGGDYEGVKVSSGFYSITLKHLKSGSLEYGRNKLDFQEGSLFFTSPDQIGTITNPVFKQATYNWGLFFHSDLILGTPLASKISGYSFFKYSANEALHLSESERESLTNIIRSIETELNRPIDNHTKSVLVSAIVLLLNHCNRYFDRQFITRQTTNELVVSALDDFLSNYFATAVLQEQGLPTVLQCAEFVNLSPNYLSDLLRRETGKTTQEHIHFYMLEVAKEFLLGTNHSVKEIAHLLGFDYPHYFSNIFKKKTGMSPTEYRNFN